MTGPAAVAGCPTGGVGDTTDAMIAATPASKCTMSQYVTLILVTSIITGIPLVEFLTLHL